MRSLSRALAALKVLSSHPAGLTLRELTTELCLPMASTRRMLEALCDEEFLERSPTTKRYYLSAASRALNSTAALSARLHHVPPGAIARAAVAANETVMLAELWSGRPVCVALAPGRRLPRPAEVLGADLHCGRACSWRILVTDVSEDVLRRLWRHSVGNPTGRLPEEEHVVMAVAKARERGYDISRDEIEPAAWAVSVPVRDLGGRVKQSVTVVSTVSRASRPAVRARYLGVARRAASELCDERKAEQSAAQGEPTNGIDGRLTALSDAAHVPGPRIPPEYRLQAGTEG
jgi:IclR family acetate operon transcriptional repressor